MWAVELLNATVRSELDGLSDDILAHFRRIVDLIQRHGLQKVRGPYTKHLQGRLWEIRLKGKDGIARAIYVTASGERVVVVRVFVKKTQRTPPREIKLALLRAKDVE